MFNSTQIVPDVDAAVAFYTDMLGFNLVYRGEIELSEDEPNVLGIPRNLVKPAPNVAIVSPTDTTGGSVEFIALPHLKGGDYTRYAQPPNRGILTLRFPVTNLAAYHEHLKEKGVDVVTEPVTLRLEPYGEVSLMAVQTPNGVWLEFFEATCIRKCRDRRTRLSGSGPSSPLSRGQRAKPRGRESAHDDEHRAHQYASARLESLYRPRLAPRGAARILPHGLPDARECGGVAGRGVFGDERRGI